MQFFKMTWRIAALCWAWPLFTPADVSARDTSPLKLSYDAPAVRRDADGGGFRAGTMEAGVSVGAGIGMPILFSKTAHDWALTAVDFGWIFTDVVAKDKWYRGNWELVGEVFGGAQFNPDVAYFIGVTPLVRYNFATSGRFVPFINAGAGATATDIRNGDLSTTFEFNLQGGAGVHWFVGDRCALTVQYRWIHLSNAGTQFPNLGLNTSTFLAGVSWFF